MTPNPISNGEVSPQERQLLLAAYQDFNARNIDAVLARMTSDVDWANGMEGGYEKGHENVKNYWTRQAAQINAYVEPVTFKKDHAGRIIVHVHQIIRDLSGNLLLEGMVPHVYKLEGELIRRMDIEHS